GLPRALAPVTEVLAAERKVSAALLDDPARDAEVEKVAGLVDARPPPNLELGLLEGRRALVLHDLHAHTVADELVAVLDLPDAPHIEANTRIELERVAARRGLGAAEDDANL